jgi:dihydroxyacetone kinase-like protein
MDSFTKEEGILILDNIIKSIQENKQYLSDIDGMIGDGDHGVNMNKGFTLCREAMDKNPGDLAHGFSVLAKVLIMKIGGAMGPLYGKLFKSISEALADVDIIDAGIWGKALTAAKDSIQTISQAKAGDKTLVDALFPAVDAYHAAMDAGRDFAGALSEMKNAAEAGRDSTENMVAKIGRSSRLGERSVGVIDPGAASCALMLGTMADTITELIN